MATRKKTSKRKSAKRPGTARSADALALLRTDHTKVQDLFSQFEKARSDDRKRTLAEQICAELTVHATIEEEIFYPAVREVLAEEDLLDEAAVEHASAKELISQFQGGSPDDDKWDAKVTVLGEYIKHHVKEEQNEMFPKVRKTKLDLRLIGDQLRARKQQLQA
jgi:hemerythrin superfamily protein